MMTKKGKLKLLWQIFISFLKIGPVTFGGGYAMIPLIESEVVERRKWMKTSAIADVFAIAESIPGAIAINSATFIGYRVAGVAGAIAAMIGILLPTFFIVIVLSIFFLKVQHHPKIESAFVAIRATIVALIAYAAIKIGKTAVVDKTTVGFIILTVSVLFFTHLHPIILIVIGGTMGVATIFVKKKLGLKIRLENSNQIRKRYKYKDYFVGDGI